MNRTVRRIIRDMRSRDAQAQGGALRARGADLRLMREMNRRLVLNSVRLHGPVSRVAVARETGLSRTTVGSIMDALIAEGLVREGETQKSAAPSGGRRAILVHFNASAGYILGVDMGRTHLTVVLCDLAAAVLARHSGPFDANCGPQVCLPQLAAALRGFLETHGVGWEEVVGVGVGMPGPMDAVLHRPIAPPRMPGWDGVDVAGTLGCELGVPVLLDNDANLGALGESRYGAGVGVDDLVYVKLGTGIGCGLVMGGQVYRGCRGSAGEIGHVTVDEDGPLCDCGNRGCLEALSGADAIVEDARRAISLREGGRAPDGPGALDALAAPDLEAVVGAARRGDPACRAALTRAGERIGIALAGLVNVVNPSLILVDGGVARAGELLLDPIRRVVAARSIAIAAEQAQIRTGALGDGAIARGAVAMVVDAAFVAARDGHPLAVRAATGGGLVGRRRGAERAGGEDSDT